MVLAGMLLVSYFRSVNRVSLEDRMLSSATELEDDGLISKTDIKEDVVKTEPKAGGEYVVEKGDSLWKISMKTYGTGYAWEKIYEANKGVLGNNPSQISSGIRLVLPDTSEASIDYTVSKGDTLWSISHNMCGNGNVWNTIASYNNIENPRTIEPGQILRIRCK